MILHLRCWKYRIFQSKKSQAKQFSQFVKKKKKIMENAEKVTVTDDYVQKFRQKYMHAICSKHVELVTAFSAHYIVKQGRCELLYVLSWISVF